MTEEWKGLTEDGKKPYDALQLKEKDRYTREMAAYKKKLEAAAKDGAPADKQEKLVGKKRPATAPAKVASKSKSVEKI